MIIGREATLSNMTRASAPRIEWIHDKPETSDDVAKSGLQKCMSCVRKGRQDTVEVGHTGVKKDPAESDYEV